LCVYICYTQMYTERQTKTYWNHTHLSPTLWSVCTCVIHVHKYTLQIKQYLNKSLSNNFICEEIHTVWFRFMVFNATFKNIPVISWRSVLLVEDFAVPGENHRPVTRHWQTLSDNIVLSTPRHEQVPNSQL
jgi:hypothetical protein